MSKSALSKLLLAEVRELTKQLKGATGKRRRALLSQRCDKVIEYILSLRPSAQAALIALILRRFDT